MKNEVLQQALCEYIAKDKHAMDILEDKTVNESLEIAQAYLLAKYLHGKIN